MRKKLRKFLAKAIFTVILTAVVLVGLLYLVILAGFFGRLPDKESLRDISNEEASLVYSSDKVLIGKYFAENRTNISQDDIPSHLKDALIATEDRRFYAHKGYDTRSYVRVFFKTIVMGDRSSGGGSTITQQLIKNLYGRGDYGPLSISVNKIKELIIASRMEKVYTKDEILLLYLNSVPFGEDLYGVESAAHRYFNNAVRNLKTEESAILVGMLKANTYFNPQLNPANSMARRNTVLSLMAEIGYLDRIEADSLKALPLSLDYNNLNLDAPAGYFVYRVQEQATRLLNEVNKNTNSDYQLEKDGLRIYTTLDMRVQGSAMRATSRHLKRMQVLLDNELQERGEKRRWYSEMENNIPGGNNDKNPVQLFDWDGITSRDITRIDSLWHYYRMLNASVLATNPHDGSVLAWIGGNNFRLLPFDMVLSHRQAASAFKPFLYATALEEGFDPCYYLGNKETEYSGYPDWHPSNANGKSTPDSTVAMWYALAHSLNLPAVDMYFKLGGRKLGKKCKTLGFTWPEEEAPSVALGTLDLSLYELVRAYGVFASGGEMHEPVMIDSICNAEGQLIYTRPNPQPKIVFSKNTCQTVTAMLQQVTGQGTAASIRSNYGIKTDLAGKTGTAVDYSDAWFIAYTPDIVIGTWVGARMPEVHFSNGLGSGSALAMPVAAYIIGDMERNSQMRRTCLGNFDLPSETYSFLDCKPYRQTGIKGFIKQLFEGRKEVSDTTRTDDGNNIRSLIRKIFKKK